MANVIPVRPIKHGTTYLASAEDYVSTFVSTFAVSESYLVLSMM